MNALKPNDQRGRIALVMIWIVLATEVMVGISTYFEYALLLEAQNGGSIPEESIQANDERQQLLSMLAIVAYASSFVTFIMWFRRAYYNLHQRMTGLEFGEGWAAGAWFVPFINLLRPYTIMRELYVETATYLQQRKNVFHAYTTNFVNCWWLFWIGNWLVSRVSAKLTLNAVTIEALLWSD